MVLRNALSTTKFNVGFYSRPFRRKFRSLLGMPPTVPLSCQIPDVIEKFRSLGLRRQKGFFVEVGGFDGETYSNTCFLADDGWQGVYVEPVPAFCRKIRWRHLFNDVAVEQVAIAEKETTLSFFVDGPLSTAQEDVDRAHENLGWLKKDRAKKQIKVPALPINAVLSKNGVPENFDLMVIDIEGGERAVINSLFASSWRPRILVVELCDLHPQFTHFPRLQKIDRENRSVIRRNGYKEYYADHINTIFVRA